jgi:hypothetical protein
LRALLLRDIYNCCFTVLHRKIIIHTDLSFCKTDRKDLIIYITSQLLIATVSRCGGSSTVDDDNVFDLTGGASDDDNKQEIRLGDVRKELEPPSGKKKKRKNKRYNNGTGGLKTTGLSDDIIVIDSDDSDNDDYDDDDVIEVDPLAAGLAASNGYRPNKKVKKEGYRKYKTAVDNNNNNNDE